MMGFATAEDLRQVETSLDDRTERIRVLEHKLAVIDDDLEGYFQRLLSRVVWLEKQIPSVATFDPRVAEVCERTGFPPESVEAVIKALDEVANGDSGSD